MFNDEHLMWKIIVLALVSKDDTLNLAYYIYITHIAMQTCVYM